MPLVAVPPKAPLRGERWSDMQAWHGMAGTNTYIGQCRLHDDDRSMMVFALLEGIRASDRTDARTYEQTGLQRLPFCNLPPDSNWPAC